MNFKLHTYSNRIVNTALYSSLYPFYCKKIQFLNVFIRYLIFVNFEANVTKTISSRDISPSVQDH